MAVNALIVVLGALALAGAGVGMAALAAGPLGMDGGRCPAGQGGCPSHGGGGCAGVHDNPSCRGAGCNQTNAACPGISEGTCPFNNGTDSD